MAHSKPINGRGEEHGWIVQLSDDFASMGMRLDIAKRESNGRVSEVEPIELVLKEVKPGGYPGKPTLVLDPFQSEALLQALYAAFSDAGINPEPESFTKGKLEATEKHLQDMRVLARVVEERPKK